MALSFDEREERGQIGQNFVERYGEFIMPRVAMRTMKTAEFQLENHLPEVQTEGSDFVTFASEPAKNDLTGGFGHTENVEVKLFADLDIVRYHRMGMPCISFPLYYVDDTDAPPSAWTKYSWLYRIFHAEECNESGRFRTDTVQPDVLVLLYYEEKVPDMNSLPFLSVAFGDTDALYERLCELAERDFPGKIDLRRWNLTKPEEYVRLQYGDYRNSRNFWRVPVNDLADLAYAVFVNGKPALAGHDDQYNRAENLDAHYQKLKRVFGLRWIDTRSIDRERKNMCRSGALHPMNESMMCLMENSRMKRSDEEIESSIQRFEQEYRRLSAG